MNFPPSRRRAVLYQVGLFAAVGLVAWFFLATRWGGKVYGK
mgnify:CR=1 FL=1